MPTLLILSCEELQEFCDSLVQGERIIVIPADGGTRVGSAPTRKRTATKTTGSSAPATSARRRRKRPKAGPGQ